MEAAIILKIKTNSIGQAGQADLALASSIMYDMINRSKSASGEQKIDRFILLGCLRGLI